MKYLIIFLSALFVISCGGESLEEKNKKIEQENTRIENIKLSTCAVLKETTEEQNAFRVKELNSARASIGQEPFIDGDKVIQNAIKFGLCESLVGNDADFNQQYSNQKDIHISRSCEELNLSYAPKEITEENRRVDLFQLFDGFSWDEKFRESINLQKMSMVEAFRINFNLPSFHGSNNDINKFQFLGLCKELLIDDSNAITKRLNAYDKIIKISENSSDEIYLNANINYVTNNGEIYFKKVVGTRSESADRAFGIIEPISDTKQSFINLDTLKEITKLKFDGVVQELSLEDRYRYLIITPLRFEVKDGKHIGDLKTYYHNGDLKSLRSRASMKLKNGLTKGEFIAYGLNGNILFDKFEYCYKNDEKVDLEECN